MARLRLIIQWTFILILAGVFIYAGSIKMSRPDLLLLDIQSYDLVSYRIAYMGALLLPSLEIVTGLGLLIRSIRKESSLILISIMLVFIAALLSAWSRGLDISCGCFGQSEIKANYPLLVARDVALILSLSIVLLIDRKNVASNVVP